MRPRRQSIFITSKVLRIPKQFKPISKLSTSKIAKATWEKIFMVYLYAIFEAALRDYWKLCRKRTTRPRMKDLLDAIAAYQTIPFSDLQKAHHARDYRNDIVHVQNSSTEEISFGNMKSYLSIFISRLPRDW